MEELPMPKTETGLLRRRDLLLMGAGGLVFSQIGRSAPGPKPLRGIFPIAQTPFTASDRLDVGSLVEEVRFIDRGGVHGFVWPQNASEWETLTEAERLEGAEAIASTGKKLRPAIVIGVQAGDTATSIRYAKHAEKAGADAIISLPPASQSDPAAVLEYYRQIGGATGLPLFVQAVGNLSVDDIVAMYKAIPAMRYVKDEAGQPLMRFAGLQSATGGELKVFSGGGGRTLIDEMIRGFSGSMPHAAFADVYASAWDLWHSGKQREAIQQFGIASVLLTEIGTYPEAVKYILYARGVFKTYQSRRTQRPGSAAADPKALASGRGQSTAVLDDTSQKVLRQMLDLMKPFLKA
jgi:4-hydroxy-tetrahydrodipicolinate synthase